MDLTSKRRLPALALTVLLALGLQTAPAAAFPRINHWWQYGTDAFTRTWRSDPALLREYSFFEARNPNATSAEVASFVGGLEGSFRARFFHTARSGEHSGLATWFTGAIGACGKPLRGLYAASKTLPCGSLVSVRSGGRYVMVTILDRGPYGPGRILDLSPSAFKKLAPRGTGVIRVTAVRVAKG